MKKTRIVFEDIKAGDMIEAVAVINGIKYSGTGIAFEKTKTKQGDAEWQTSEGGTLTIEDDEDAIYRIDVAEVKFEDIRAGDLIRVTREQGYTETTITGRASYVTTDLSNNYWLTIDGHMLTTRLETGTIEILEREGE